MVVPIATIKNTMTQLTGLRASAGLMGMYLARSDNRVFLGLAGATVASDTLRGLRNGTNG